MLPCASVAVQVIVVVPTGNSAANSAASLRTPTSVRPGQLSEAVVPSDAIVAPHAPAVGTVRFDVAIVGFSVSLTVTVKLVFVLPHALVAVAVTVVTPTGNTVPGFCEYVMVGAGEPVAVAANETVAPHWPAALAAV